MYRLFVIIIVFLSSTCLFGQSYLYTHSKVEKDSIYPIEVESDITDAIMGYMGHFHTFPKSKNDIISFIKCRHKKVNPKIEVAILAQYSTIGMYGDCFYISNHKTNQTFLVVGYLDDWFKYHYFTFVDYYQPAYFNSSGDYLWMPDAVRMLLPGQDELNKQYVSPLRMKVYGLAYSVMVVPHRLHFSYSKGQGIVLKKDYGIDMAQYSEYLKDLESLLDEYVRDHPEVDSIDFFSPVYSKKK